MQPWQINALELEGAVLKRLDGFVHDHALYFLIGSIYVLLALLVWVLCGGLRSKGRTLPSQVRPAIIIHLPGSPPPRPTETFDPFPPLRDCDCDHDHDDWED